MKTGLIYFPFWVFSLNFYWPSAHLIMVKTICKKHMFSSLLMCLHLIESAVTREIRSWVVGMWGSLYSSLLIAWFKLCNKKYIKPLYIEPSLPFVFQLNFLLEKQYHILYSLCTYLESIFNLLQSFETAKWQQINSLFFYIEV